MSRDNPLMSQEDVEIAMRSRLRTILGELRIPRQCSIEEAMRLHSNLSAEYAVLEDALKWYDRKSASCGSDKPALARKEPHADRP